LIGTISDKIPLKLNNWATGKSVRQTRSCPMFLALVEFPRQHHGQQ
jgi:hypothetical protein